MGEKTTESEQALEEKLIEISNELSNEHAKFVEDLYDFGDMWLLCDIVKEFVKSKSERTSETAGEVSPLIGMVSVHEILNEEMKRINKELQEFDERRRDFLLGQKQEIFNLSDKIKDSEH
jgi:flagellar hook-basal body complex protein FliE